MAVRSCLAMAFFVRLVLCDELEWVNPRWVLSQNTSSSNLSGAKKYIIDNVKTRSKNGPWSVTNSSIYPIGKIKNDYLSWAPYHWPDCNWCSKKRDAEDAHPLELLALPSSQSNPHLVIPLERRASKASKTKSPSCTPSPTKMAPSATWTTCPYVPRDGKRNPDVDVAVDSGYINQMPAAVLYNTMAYAITQQSKYADAAAHYIDTFFLAKKTALNPNLEYGQLIRGPGAKKGQYMGVLDARGFISVINSIMTLKSAKNSAWTSKQQDAMSNWVGEYLSWLLTSELGLKAAKSANNHGTFYTAQVSALKLYLGDTNGVKKTINYFLTHQFQDQIAASGDQPFEAVRTRPFHYRCFNLEALLVLAKIGDEVGLNVWEAESRYGTTIKDAASFLVRPGANRKKEDPTQLSPHLAAAAVAYGDPSKTYARYIKDVDSRYASRPYSFYDQTGAFGPRAKKGKRDLALQRERDAPNPASDPAALESTTTDTIALTAAVRPKWHDGEDPIRPEAFDDADVVQLDDAVFVTWDDIRPYYLLNLDGPSQNGTMALNQTQSTAGEASTQSEERSDPIGHNDSQGQHRQPARRHQLHRKRFGQKH